MRTRIPRDVPPFERSPAPRAPKPRMVRRISLAPYRDCANTPGTAVTASSSEYPRFVSSCFFSIKVTASGASKIEVVRLVAVIVTFGSFTSAESRSDSCASDGLGRAKTSSVAAIDEIFFMIQTGVNAMRARTLARARKI